MKHIVEISDYGRRLSLDRGFLVVKAEDKEIGRVPLDDILSVVLNVAGCGLTAPVLLALVERGIGLVICGEKHLPKAWLLPVGGHHAQTKVITRQAKASQFFNSQLWQMVIQLKLMSQAAAVEAIGGRGQGLRLLAEKVEAGDPSNIEAQAAKRYWTSFFGSEFRRDREAEDINIGLNYGYTVLRSMVARAVVSQGLHPSLSLKHNRDPLALTDDLMEPFRPFVDFQVRNLQVLNIPLNKFFREKLVDSLTEKLPNRVEEFVHLISKSFLENKIPNLTEGKACVVDSLFRPPNEGTKHESLSECLTSTGILQDTTLNLCETNPRVGEDLSEKITEAMPKMGQVILLSLTDKQFHDILRIENGQIVKYQEPKSLLSF